MIPCQTFDADNKLLDRCTDVQIKVTDLTGKKKLPQWVRVKKYTFKLTSNYMRISPGRINKVGLILTSFSSSLQTTNNLLRVAVVIVVHSVRALKECRARLDTLHDKHFLLKASPASFVCRLALTEVML